MKKSAQAFSRAVAAIAAAVLLLPGCMDDRQPNGPVDPDGPKSGDVAVTLRLRTPDGFAPPSTRAISYDQEVALGDVRVLVFNASNRLEAIVPVSEITQPSKESGRLGAITLELSPASYSRKLVVLTNLNGLDDVDPVPDGDDDWDNGVDRRLATLLENTATLPEVIAGLKSVKVVGYLWDDPNAASNTIPMWGETTVRALAADSDPVEITGEAVTLMRAVARIDVGVGVPHGGDHGEWTWDGKKIDGLTRIPFELKSVHVIRSSGEWAVIPDPAAIVGNTAVAPTVLNSGDPGFVAPGATADAITNRLVYGGTQHEEPVVTPSQDDNGSYITRTIYIPEADVTSYPGGVGSKNYVSRPAIVVGGWWAEDGDFTGFDDDDTTYYRIDFKRKNGSDDSELFDVLRNYLYQFNILNVSGPGKPTVDEAYESEAMEMTVDVLDWNDSDNDVEWIGQQFFSFGRRPVLFDAGAQTHTVNFTTNIDSGFTMSLGETDDTGADQVELKIVAPDDWQEGDNTTYPGVDAKFDYTLILTDITSGVYTYTLAITAAANFPAIDEKVDDWTIVVGDNRLTTRFEVRQQASATDPTPHNVALTQTSGGTALASHTTATATTPVTLLATPDAYRKFVSWEFTEGGDEVGLGAFPADNPLVFAMPAADVAVRPVWTNVLPLPPLPTDPTLNRGFILYFEDTGDNPRLLLSEWDTGIPGNNNPDDYEKVLNRYNFRTQVALFKFGSVIGMSNDGIKENRAKVELSDIKYNPSTLTIGESGDIRSYSNGATGNVNEAYMTIVNSPPAIPGYLPAHYNATPRINDVSKTRGDGAYHTYANLLEGLGDPCQLVGLSPGEIRVALDQGEQAFNDLIAARNTNPQYAGWRLPTSAENQNFVGTDQNNLLQESDFYNWHVTGTPNSTNPASAEIQQRGVYLPAAGGINYTGIVYDLGTWGYFWASTPDGATAGTQLAFYTPFLWPSSYYTSGLAGSIRCVRPDPSNDAGFNNPGQGPDDWDDENSRHDL